MSSSFFVCCGGGVCARNRLVKEDIYYFNTRNPVAVKGGGTSGRLPVPFFWPQQLYASAVSFLSNNMLKSVLTQLQASHLPQRPPLTQNAPPKEAAAAAAREEVAKEDWLANYRARSLLRRQAAASAAGIGRRKLRLSPMRSSSRVLPAQGLPQVLPKGAFPFDVPSCPAPERQVPLGVLSGALFHLHSQKGV